MTSFAAYLNAYDEGHTKIFADMARLQFVGVLDYHKQPRADEDVAASPEWGSHKATLTMELSRQWQQWNSINNKDMGQIYFAEWLEDHLSEILEPDAASILEAATSLEASKTVKFKSAHNLSNGSVEFGYSEAIEEKGKGKFTIPTRFKIAIPVFKGQEPKELSLRLRWSIKDEALKFKCIIDRVDDISDEEVEAVTDQIATDTGYSVFYGKP